ncbi:enterobacterial Ail/Lom family protein [Escherichia coli P0302293.10]|nr:enterobacterial Ail/Lom family protein [Escherichia coli P0302293.10]
MPDERPAGYLNGINVKYRYEFTDPGVYVFSMQRSTVQRYPLA